MNLIEGIQERCNYIREVVIPEYDRLGPTGMLGKMLLLADIAKGEKAIASDDVIEMVRVYKELIDTTERAL